MPFINDMLQDTERRRQEADALRIENRAQGDVVAAHLEPSALNSRFRFDVGVIEQQLRGEIIGQDAAIESVLDMLHVVRADISDPRRPLHTSLLLGPTGVGKTELVRALARALHGDADALCRVDMNTLAQEHYAAAITGAPPGYVGSKEGRTILDQDKIEGSLGRPGIVLFDELEKASPEVVLSLLNILDNGILTVASGERTYSFRNAIIFMTSNLGARKLIAEARSRRMGWRWLFPQTARARRARLHTIAQDALLSRFPPEFVNRIDTIQVFNWIEPQVVEALIALEIERLNRRLLKHNCRIEVSGELLAYLAKEGFDRRFGARSLRRAVRRHVEVPFAQFLLTDLARLTQDSALHRFIARRENGTVRFSEAETRRKE